MKFLAIPLAGAHVVALDQIADDRGFFARSFCARDFAAQGLAPVIAQANLSFNHVKGTLRGLHCQMAPASEAKLVRCTAGAI